MYGLYSSGSYTELKKACCILFATTYRRQVETCQSLVTKGLVLYLTFLNAMMQIVPFGLFPILFHF